MTRGRHALKVDHMHYIIFVDDKMMYAPVLQDDHNYFCKILPFLKPLSDEDYMSGSAYLLQTMAKYSYILFEKDVYWCVERSPGLIVVRFSPDGAMASAALRSPVPDFGGRKPDPRDLGKYDPDAENHQYNLVFRAWDAQFDEQWRKWSKFKVAGPKIIREFEAALAHADKLSSQLEKKYTNEARMAAWIDKCEKNVDEWAGEGARIE